MQIITDQDLLDRVNAFLEETGIPPTRFGLDALGDGALVKQLREGRSLSLRNVNKVWSYMDELLESRSTEAALTRSSGNAAETTGMEARA